ncbi:MAG: hypothetical protein QXF38_00830 [Pyrobaculum sp.]
MVEYVEVGIDGKKDGVKLTNLTFLIGSGKSLFLEVVYRVLSNVGRKIPSIKRDWYFYAESGGVSLSISVNKSRYRQTITTQGEEVVFEYIPSRKVHRIIKPIETAVAAANIVIPEIKTEEHVSIVAEEDIERLNDLLTKARRGIGVRVQMLGPYVSPMSLIDADIKYSGLDRHGKNLPLVLSYLSLYSPASYDYIRNIAKKFGFSLSVGVAKPGKVGVLISTRAFKLPLAKAPCSLKYVLTIATALELKPDLLIIDNFDYCLTRKAVEILSTILRQKDTRVMAEIHNEEIVDWFNIPNKNIVSVDL